MPRVSRGHRRFPSTRSALPRTSLRVSLEEIDPAARFDHIVVPFDATTTTPIDELLLAVAPLLRERGSLVALMPGPAWPVARRETWSTWRRKHKATSPTRASRWRRSGTGHGAGGRVGDSGRRGAGRGDRPSRSAHARGRRAARIGIELGAMTGMRELARRYLPVQVRRSWRRLKGQPFTPPPGAVRLGDLRRTTPIASDFGYSRGGPVDRYYIESFLEQHQLDVRGRVLEIGDSAYTTRFGGARVTQADVLHIDPEAPGATFVGDLADGSFLPDDAFDCVVLTQTLHLVYDFGAALRTIARVLAPGGVLLMTVPGISNVDAAEWGSTWHYSFTRQSVQRMCEAAFADFEIEVTSFGNVLAAVAFLHGLGRDELSRQELDDFRPEYGLIHAARVVKPLTRCATQSAKSSRPRS